MCVYRIKGFNRYNRYIGKVVGKPNTYSTVTIVTIVTIGHYLRDTETSLGRSWSRTGQRTQLHSGCRAAHSDLIR
jgi:hypothetical protein